MKRNNFEKNKIEKLPIVNSANELIGLITFRDIIKVKKQPMRVKIIMEDLGLLQQ